MQNRDKRRTGYLFAALAILLLTAGASCGGGEIPEEVLSDLIPDIVDDPPEMPDENGGAEDGDEGDADDGDDDGTVDDGDQDVPLTAVFVSASLGNDANSGTYLRPVATIARGVQIAAQNSLADIFVMHGTYGESVAPGSGMNLRGCVASVNSSGDVTFSQESASTVIAAPAGSPLALNMDGVSDVSIDCFTVHGGQDAYESIGALVKDSQNVELSRIAFMTPGAAGAICRDLKVEGSSGVNLAHGEFANSGLCADYAAVSVVESDDVTISHESAPASFVFQSGAEAHAKAVKAADTSSIEISGAQISDDGAPLADHTVFTGILLSDSANARVEGNLISAEGGKHATGISMRCNQEAVHCAAEQNSIALTGAVEGATGLRINCPMPDGSFGVLRNRMLLTAMGGAGLSVKGVEADAQMRPMQIEVTNNIVLMPLADSDMADKVGVELKKLNKTGSAIAVMHNTFIMLANQGRAAAIRTDMGSTQFSALGNVFFVYGPDAGNALFALKKSCQADLCARDAVANLANTKFYAIPLKMAYYYDTAETEPLSVINECDDDPLIPHCANQQAQRSANQLSASMNPEHFDMDLGELFLDYQPLAVDLGPQGTGVLIDIDGRTRDALPDIGATEY